MSNEDSSKTVNGVSPYSEFLAYHKAQLELSGVPVHLWEVLFRKLTDQIFDANEAFVFLAPEEDEEQSGPAHKVHALTDICKNDQRHIYLIDHAWTYRVSGAKRQLQETPQLVERMASLMNIDTTNKAHLQLVDCVFDEMWKYNRTYSLNGLSVDIEDRMPVWYVMDEVGSSIRHSDEPNFRAVPLVYIPEQVTYTLLFPIKDLVNGEEVTRDFLEGQINDADMRKALLLPWHPHSFVSRSFKLEEPDEHYFLDGHVRESLPDLSALAQCPQVRDVDVKLKVYSEYRFINDYLTHPGFEIVFDDSEADILWTMSHFKLFEEFSVQCPTKFINQFPFENVITIKDLLSIVSRRNISDPGYDVDTLETLPVWLPSTFNLKTELVQFVSYFQQRAERGLGNYWIIKPWNLARGLDTHITNNLNFILKLFFSGPKIVQKYIERPVLFTRPDIGDVKFDIRYVILLKSVAPLEVYAYRNFFLRFANHEFALADFDDYEKHFTVMNYQEDTPLCRLLCHEYIARFEEQHPQTKWRDVEDKIFAMLHAVMEAAVSEPPPRGIVHSPQSRALYAADIMLARRTDASGSEEMQPKLLEINWTPDCKRACEYYPDFYNDIFALLFLDQEKPEVFEKLAKP